MGVIQAIREFFCAPRQRLKKQHAEAGQMTVEFVVVFPVLVIIAVIAVNALLFFSECAAFDNAFREAVRVYATSPEYGQGLEQSRAQVESLLAESFDYPFESSHVAVESVDNGHARFTATVELAPTLFGLGLRSSVFGVALPPLTHEAALVVDCYKPGMLL